MKSINNLITFPYSNFFAGETLIFRQDITYKVRSKLMDMFLGDDSLKHTRRHVVRKINKLIDKE